MALVNIIMWALGGYMIASNPANWFIGGLLMLLGTTCYIQDRVILGQRKTIEGIFSTHLTKETDQ